jgi:hypothetical protein
MFGDFPPAAATSDEGRPLALLIVKVLPLLKHLEHGQFIFVLLHEIRKVVEEHPAFRT